MSSNTPTRSSSATTKTDSGLRRLFTGQSDYDFVGRSRTWALVSVALLVLAVLGVGVRGLNFSIEFTGGTVFLVEEVEADFDVDEMRAAVSEEVDTDVLVDRLEDQATGDVGAQVTTPALGDVGGSEEREVAAIVAEQAGVDAGEVSRDSVGPRWGEQVTDRALYALVAFLLLVSAYIAVRFEWRMAVGAFVTLLHDITLTIGLYAIVGFAVSPASVIALLTILGYSLYDTVVVFDRVSEDTAGLGSTSSRTYGEFANDALNRVLVRSISTSVTSLLPVGSILFVGGQLLAADTLMDLALALFVGMAVGTYSSIFVATPVLVWLKERQPELAELKEKIIARRGGEAAAALAGTDSGGRGGSASEGRSGRRGRAGRDRQSPARKTNTTKGKTAKGKKKPPSRGP